MVGLTTLWLPIVGSAVVVFIASWIVHTALKYHKTDFGQLPNESEIRGTVGSGDVAPGQYMFPHPGDPKKVGTKEHMEMWKDGPVGYMVVMSNDPGMGRNLALWFVFCLVISVFVAYITGRTMGRGAEYLAVFRIAGVVSILAYAAAQIPRSIWYGYSWSSTLKNGLDGVIYGLLTAGVFGWLWPN